MRKLVNVTAKLPEDVLQELKEKSGEPSTKEALYKAIHHFLYCQYTHDGDVDNIGHSIEHEEDKRKSSGRKPVYLAKIQENFD